jgi:hypothetical protein
MKHRPFRVGGSFLPSMIVAFVLMGLAPNKSTAQSEPPVALEFGLRAGIPFHNIVQYRLINITGQQSFVENSERPWIAVGPTFAAVLYDQVQVELEAIYKPVRFETDTLACANSDCTRRVFGIAVHESVRGHLWEFPLTANYYFGRRRLRPYAGGGIVLRQSFGGKCGVQVRDEATGMQIVSPIPPSCFALGDGLLQHGPSVLMDVGLRRSYSHLSIQPEFRYTRHWPKTQPDPRTTQLLVPRGDQVELLVGFFFTRR